MNKRAHVLIVLFLVVFFLMLPLTTFAAESSVPELDFSVVDSVANSPSIGLYSLFAKIINGDKLVIGENFTLKDGDELVGNLFVLNGNLDLNEGSKIIGDVLILGGSFDISGLIQGDVMIAESTGEITSSSRIMGDVLTLGDQVTVDDNAEIDGQIMSSNLPNTTVDLSRIFSLNFGNVKEFPNLRVPITGFSMAHFLMKIITGIIWYFLRSFLWAILAILVVLFFEKPVNRVIGATVKQPLISFSMGLLTVLGVLGLVLIFAITIFGIPISLLIVFVFLVSWAFGIVSIGVEVGNRFSKAFHQNWSPVVAAGIGTLVLTLVINGIGEVVPCVGWLLPATVGMIGLGAMVLTKFGSTSYPLSATVATNQKTVIVPVDSQESSIVQEDTNNLSGSNEDE